VKDLSELVRQAQKMQAEMARAEAMLEAAEVEGEAGAGMVRATLNGKGVVRHLHIDPSLLKPEEAGVLEDLIRAAVNDAKTKADAKAQQTMKDVAGGLAGMLPPGFTPPF
jgi:DNA-binding YbaB/EbfC family protein